MFVNSSDTLEYLVSFMNVTDSAYFLITITVAKLPIFDIADPLYVLESFHINYSNPPPVCVWVCVYSIYIYSQVLKYSHQVLHCC